MIQRCFDYYQGVLDDGTEQSTLLLGWVEADHFAQVGTQLAPDLIDVS
jgi:hypothetical protein